MAPRKAPPNTGTELQVKDALNSEVVLGAKLDKHGLTVKGKSRALAAFDQLVGSLVGMPAAYFEGFRRRVELRAHAREQVLLSEIKAGIEWPEQLPQLVNATLDRVVRDEVRKQINREAVWSVAEEQLALPRPGTNESSRPDDHADFKPDWLNRFANFVGDVSSDDLQLVWGRVLAGEIRSPGTFSVATLRTLSELEPDVASAFQKLFRASCDGYIATHEKVRGDTLELYALLGHAGLVNETVIHMEMEPAPEQKTMSFISGDFGLRIYRVPRGMPSYPAIMITRTGLQLGTILERDDAEALRAIARYLRHVSKVELCKTDGTDDVGNWTFVEDLSPARFAGLDV